MYLTQRRPRVRYVEQDERQDDHVVIYGHTSDETARSAVDVWSGALGL